NNNNYKWLFFTTISKPDSYPEKTTIRARERSISSLPSFPCCFLRSGFCSNFSEEISTMRIRKRKIPLPISLLSPVPITSSFFTSDPAAVLLPVPPPPPPLVQLFPHAAAAVKEGGAGAGPHLNRTHAVKSPPEIKRTSDATAASDPETMGQLRPVAASAASISDPPGAMWSKKRSGGGGGGSRVMEAGSRCSRVNGRGWRCSQPTLVGYSLCEHHLGKGRIRSISSSTSTVRSSRQLGSTSTGTSTTTSLQPKKHASSMIMISSSSSSDADQAETSRKHFVLQNHEEEDDDHLHESQKQKKKSKLGLVKARSISSLLDQPDNVVSDHI
ncbi:hypothetical protein LINPERHAP2_LOCUS7810, partial [Linum perenne]